MAAEQKMSEWEVSKMMEGMWQRKENKFVNLSKKSVIATASVQPQNSKGFVQDFWLAISSYLVRWLP